MSFKTVVFLLFTIAVQQADAQEENLVKYTSDFEFTNGIYLTFNHFKNNDPVQPEEIISTVSRDDPEYYRKIFNTRSFRITSNDSTSVSIFTEDVFGFAQNGEPFLQFGGRFRKIIVLGMLSYFAPGAGDPEVQPRFSTVDETDQISPPGESFKQIIFHFETGEFTNLTEETVADFISNAPDLHREFIHLRRKERRKQMYRFIQKYNQANPIYIPVYNNQ